MDAGYITTSWNEEGERNNQLALNEQLEMKLFTIKFIALHDGKLSEQVRKLKKYYDLIK